MKYILLFILAVLVAVGAYIWLNYRGVYYANKPSSQNIVQLIQNAAPQAPGQNQTALPLKIPDGYVLSIFASGLTDPRVITFDPSGVPIVSLTSAGRVVAIINGQPEEVIGGLNQPHGLAFLGNQLYIAETDKVSVFTYDPKNYKAFNGQKIIDLPGGGEHFTKTLLIKDNKLYVSIGSDCNACVESDSRRASIWQANLDGSNFHVYSSGLRNAVFMVINPNTNEIWATDMGRDFFG